MFNTAMLAPLLKSFGLDPENVQKWVAWAQQQIPAWMQGLTQEFQQIKASLDRIEANQNAILTKLDAIQAKQETESK